LKKDYSEFNEWFTSIQEKKRKCLVYRENKRIKALLIYKEEKEIIELDKQENLPPKKRVKIATMIVTIEGYKIGEFFLSWILKYSLDKNLEEIYLTHFIKSDDSLVHLIKEYGFDEVGRKYDNESVFVKGISKKIVESRINDLIHEESALFLAKKFYPKFYDGKKVNKFIVPIQPEYHKKLFLQKRKHTTLYDFGDSNLRDYPISMNAIKKAYISKSKINLEEGDILLFYETDKKGIGDIGIVESFYKDLKFKDLSETIGKRSVYSINELKEKSKKNNLVILFIYMGKTDKISLEKLINEKILNGPPQSIQKLSHDKYLKLRDLR
jgi:hypothetical protein